MYQYSKAFNDLWQALCGSKPLPSPVDVEWDEEHLERDMRVRPVDARLWLTPVHWAICAKCRWPGSSFNIHTLGNPAIFDVDPTDQEARTSKTFLRLIRNLTPLSRPWLRLVSEDKGRTDSTQGPAISAEELLRMLRADFTSNEHQANRHAVHNLILPLILNGMPEPFDDPTPDHRFALAVFLRICGMLKSLPKANPKFPPGVGGNPTVVRLVDDQASHGWLEWVRSLVPGAAVEDPSPEDFWRSVVTGFPNKSPFSDNTVLLLDLRLGSDWLVNVKDHFLANCDAWLGRASSLDSKIQADLASGIDTLKSITPEAVSTNHISLSLPARLIALTYPRVPIIVFSSTQDPAVLRMFAPFANIITGFSKGTLALASDPLFGSASAASLGRCQRQSERCLRIARFASAAEKYWDQFRPRTNAATGHGHVELYVDETGSFPKQSEMTVGGLVSVWRAANRAEAVASSHNYNREFLAGYSAFDFGSSIQACAPYDEAKLLAQMRAMQGNAPHLAHLSAVQIRGAADRDVLLRRLMEVFVSLVIPLIRTSCGFKSMSFSVFLATRTMPVTAKAPDPRCPYILYPYRRGNGIRPGQPDPLVFLTGDDLASRLVADSLKDYAPLGEDSLDRLEQALTIKLAYARGYDEHMTSPFVDRVVHHVKKKRETLRIPEGSDRRDIENTKVAQGWEPDVRALHEVADKSLCPGNRLDIGTEAWSCRDTFDATSNRVLAAVRLMKPKDITSLGLALSKLAGACEVPTSDNVALSLALANVCRLAGDKWERVVSAAFLETQHR